MTELTRAQKETLIYRHTHRDYKGKIGGERTILVLREGGTTAVPLSCLTEAEIVSKLPYTLKLEAERLAKKK